MIPGVRTYVCILTASVLAAPAPSVSQPDILRESAGTASLAACFPPHAAGLDIRDSARFFRGEALFDLIDGGADVFLEYGFTCAGSAHYTRDSSGSIAVDVYKMTDTLSAFGLYSYLAASTGAPAAAGQEAVAGVDFLIFWKGKHVVTITALEGLVRQDIAPLAKVVDAALARSGSVPDVVERLRRPEALCHDVVYLRGALGLFRHATFDPSGFLPPARGAVALAESCWVMVVPCGTSARCGQLFAAASDSVAELPWVRDHSLDGVQRIGGWRKEKSVLFARAGNFLVLVEGPDMDRTRRTSEAVIRVLSGP